MKNQKEKNKRYCLISQGNQLITKAKGNEKEIKVMKRRELKRIRREKNERSSKKIERGW